MKFAKIVGSPKENSGCWIHAFTAPQEEKATARGQLFGILRLSSLTSEEEVATAGKELISRFHEEYYGDLSDTAFIRLRKAVEKVSSEFKAEIAALSIIEDVFYVVIAGEGRLVFCRGGEIFNLLVGAKERVKTGSGYLKSNDHFLLGSQEFFKLVAQGTIQAALAAGSPEEAAEALAPIIHGQGNGSGAAAVIIKVEEKIVKPLAEEEVAKRGKMMILETACLAADTAKEKISEWWSLFVEKAREKERVKGPPKTLITVALILLFILGVSVILGSRQRQQLGATKETQGLLAEAKSKKDEGQQLLTLNPEKARQLLLESQGLSQQIEAAGLKGPEFTKFKQELEEALKSAIKEYSVQGTLFLDLTLIRASSAGNDWALSGNQLLILDQNQSAVYVLGANDKKSAILASGEDLRGSQKIAVGSAAAYVLAEKGIIEINLKVKSSKGSLREIPSELEVPRDSAWGEIADMEIFGGNLYLLDKGGEIWKYPASAKASAGEPAFGPKQRWLKEKVDLSQAVAMMIDGSVWVLRSNGEIIKLTQGRRSDFKIKNLVKAFSQPRALFTDVGSESLSVLDTGNSRIVVLKKTGEYDREYLWSGLKDATDLAVFEKDSQLFLLSGSKVFQISFK